MIETQVKQQDLQVSEGVASCQDCQQEFRTYLCALFAFRLPHLGENLQSDALSPSVKSSQRQQRRKAENTPFKRGWQIKLFMFDISKLYTNQCYGLFLIPLCKCIVFWLLPYWHLAELIQCAVLHSTGSCSEITMMIIIKLSTIRSITGLGGLNR